MYREFSHALFNGMFTPIDSRLVIAIPDKVPGFNVIIFIPKCSIVLLRYISVLCGVRVLNSARCPTFFLWNGATVKHYVLTHSPIEAFF